ncbi:MAG: tetratricopeptide repeat protein, partial [Kofleriaceae bacterium]
AVSPGARRLAFAVTALGGRAPLAIALGVLAGDHTHETIGFAEAAELERAGLARRVGRDLALDRSTVQAVEPVAAAELRELAHAALSRTDALTLDARAALLAHVELDGALARMACDVADQLLARGRADRARDVALRVTGASAVDSIARADLIAARAAAALGSYREALELAARAQRAGADPIEAQLLIARTSQRAGELDAAEHALAALHAAHPQHPEIAGAFARLLVTRSRYEEARAIAGSAGPLAGLRAEAAGLAAFYLGALDDADRAFAALEVTATAAGEMSAIGRALSLRGMVAQQRGQLGLASDRYRDAARRLGEVGEIHAAATAELNLGTVLVERGRASEALPRLAAASRVFGDLDATTEQIAADLNRGNALVAVGQAGEARAAAERAIARAESTPHLRAFALLVLGDARRRLGDDPGAERAYREALAIADERDDAHAQISAYIALAEAGHPPPRPPAEIDALCASDDDRDRWTIARGRLALAAPRGFSTGAAALGVAITPELARAVAEVANRAGDADRQERAF